MGATAAGLGLTKSIQNRVLAATGASSDTWYDRVETRVKSVCELCPGGCGFDVRVINGMPVKIDGNPLHPVNRGGLCPRGLAGLQSLYDPDRLVGPVRQSGKGLGQFETISWDEGLTAVSDRLAELRAKGTPERLAILGGEYRGIRDDLWQRFASAYGTPNYLRQRGLAPELPQTAARLMHGATNPISYDLSESSFVLSIGCNWLDGWISPVHQLKAYGHMRQGRRGDRAEVVHVEARMSPSAANADHWIPVKPGTEGVFAMGLAQIILRERIYDEDFAANTFGFEDWQTADGTTHTGFKRLVLEEYSPARVSRITGVRIETSVTLARKLATTRAAVVLGDNRSHLEGHDIFTQMAIHSLNALLGSIGIQGGVLSGRQRPPLSVWPEVGLDETAKRGAGLARLDRAEMAGHFLDTDAPQAFFEAVVNADEPPIDVLILDRANPLTGPVDKELVRAALAKIPFVVSLANVADEAGEYADLVLPQHHFLEGWQDDSVSFLPGFNLFSVGPPVMEPLYDTRHAGDTILYIARGMGDGMAQAMPWATYEELVKISAEGLYEAPRGYVVSTPSDERLRQVLQQQGYRAGEFHSFKSFWAALVENGAWWAPDAPMESARIRFFTPSGKFEFYPQLLETRLAGVLASSGEPRAQLLASLGVRDAENSDSLFYPRFLLNQFEDEAAEDTLVLQTYELLSIGNGVGANMPWLLEDLTSHVHASWDSWVEIHPGDAQKLGILDNDKVTLQSPTGKIEVRARLYKGTMPGVVSMPVGLGRAKGGHWAENRGVDPGDLIEDKAGASSGLGIRKVTRVRILKG
jgi:anaerobic selenocysteine-containing dehydrogenase